jgi:hypothetical protein
MMRLTAQLRASFSHHLQFPKVNHKPQPYNGPAYDQIVKDRSRYMPNFYFHYYKQPLLIA